MRAQDLSEIRFQARSKDQEILEEGGGAGLRKLDFFRFDLFLNSSATDIVLVTAQARQLKQQLRSALVAGQWRGDTALTLPLFWRRSTVSPIFFGRYPRSSLHSFVPPPPPPVPVPNKPSRFCGHKAKYTRTTTLCESRDGCPGLPVPNSPYGLCGCKATLNLNMCLKRRRTRVSSQSSGAVCTRRWCWVSLGIKQHSKK